jgi:antitoxin HicB
MTDLKVPPDGGPPPGRPGSGEYRDRAGEPAAVVLAGNILRWIIPAVEGGYVAICPALPGCVTQGETLEEARAMAREAIHGYLEALAKDGQPIPRDKELALDPVKEKVAVTLSRP